MLNVLEYGLDRATDPNENKVNQVRQLVCCFFYFILFYFFSTPPEFVWEDPDNVPGIVFFWAPQAERVSSAVTAKQARG